MRIMEENMTREALHNRREFFRRALGLAGGAALLVGTEFTVTGCNNSGSNSMTGPDMSQGVTISGNTVTIDTTAANFHVLATKNGFADIDALGRKIVVFRISDTTATAMSRICPHAGCDVTQAYSGTFSGDKIECMCHGSFFLIASGQVVAGPSRSGLQRYPVAVSGTTLIVTIS